MKQLIPSVILLLPLLSGCQITDFATASEEEQLIQLEETRKEAEAARDAADSRVERAAKAVRAAFASKDAEAFEEAQGDLEDAVQEASRAERDLLGVVDDLQRINRDIVGRSAGAVLDFVDPFLPAPLRPFSEPLAILLGSLVFSRSRKNLGRGVSSLLRGNVKDLFLYLGRALGYVHTNETTAAIALKQEAFELKTKAEKAQP